MQVYMLRYIHISCKTFTRDKKNFQIGWKTPSDLDFTNDNIVDRLNLKYATRLFLFLLYFHFSAGQWLYLAYNTLSSAVIDRMDMQCAVAHISLSSINNANLHQLHVKFISVSKEIQLQWLRIRTMFSDSISTTFY